MTNLMPVPLTGNAIDLNKTQDLINTFLSGKSKTTLRAYKQDLEQFARFLNVNDMNDAARLLLSHRHGDANHLSIKWRNHLIAQQLSPATINRRLAALRSLVTLAQTLGIISWELRVQGVKAKAYRDTRGCGLAGFKAILSIARKQREPAKAARDEAILRLLFDLGLRRSELVALNIADVDFAGSRISILGKGRTQKEPLSLPDQTKDALEDWLQHHPVEEGALFISWHRSCKGQRLTDNGVYHLIQWLGKKVRLKTKPHGIRHAAITEVLELMNGNIRVAQQFARHASPQTTIRYDDNRQDLAGDAAKRLAERAS